MVTKTISVAMSADEGSSKIVSCRWLSGLRSSLDGSADLEKILKHQVVLLSYVFLRKETTIQRYISSIRLLQKQCNSFTMRHVGKKHWYKVLNKNKTRNGKKKSELTKSFLMSSNLLVSF